MIKIYQKIDSLKNKARKLKTEITTLYYVYQDPKLGLLPKIIILFTLGYALSPIDLIPDFIAVLGYIDDLVIVPALISLSIKLIPEEIFTSVREKAIKEPIKLKKNNWFFALLFISIWVVLIAVIVLKIIKALRK
jgi:uncharacterized membrane protein YkvA (DUF1232 family)